MSAQVLQGQTSLYLPSALNPQAAGAKAACNTVPLMASSMYCWYQEPAWQIASEPSAVTHRR